MTNHQPLPPFAAWAGPRRPKMLLVGEAWGEGEEKLRQPFVGYSGQELWRMLGEALPDCAPELHTAASDMFKYDLAWVSHRGAWLEASGIAMTNVLGLRPPGNKLELLCGSKADVGKDYSLPAIAHGKYLRSEYLPEVARLHSEIREANPRLLVACGNTACWAILRAVNIGSIRGTITNSYGVEGGPWKTLPTYHPAGVMRQWGWRPIVVADLMKAAREAEFPDIRRPARQVTVNPTLPEISHWVNRTLATPPVLLASDIETQWGQISCISFARSRSDAITVPFIDPTKLGANYWPDEESEEIAWRYVRVMLESEIPKIFQNGLYDLQYILKIGIRPAALAEDSMLLHHSLYPEMRKGLGFLGSIYTSEPAWKLMRRRRPDTEKRDE
jgi:uracil-DNA glycosylase